MIFAKSFIPNSVQIYLFKKIFCDNFYEIKRFYYKNIKQIRFINYKLIRRKKFETIKRKLSEIIVHN